MWTFLLVSFAIIALFFVSLIGYLVYHIRKNSILFDADLNRQALEETMSGFMLDDNGRELKNLTCQKRKNHLTLVKKPKE